VIRSKFPLNIVVARYTFKGQERFPSARKRVLIAPILLAYRLGLLISWFLFLIVIVGTLETLNLSGATETLKTI